jgi:phosphoribosylaminoimidazole (AIR) synthetase
MGIGFEIITKKESVGDILDEAEKFDIGAKIIGRCERGKRGNQVKIASKFGKFEYR